MKKLIELIFIFLILASFSPSIFAIKPVTIKPVSAAGTAPIIYSVTPIMPTQSQVIHIYGSGFTNTYPQTVNLGDGSVDTVESSTTPSIYVANFGAGTHSWSAGFWDPWYDMIGIILTSWSDNEIVLGGFGSWLGTNEQGTWNIAAGDPMEIHILTPNGNCQYSLTVGATNQLPIVAFDATPTSGDAPLTVLFTDKSSGDGITSIVWQYKLNTDSAWTTFTLDGTSSFIFSSGGIYDVKLSVTGTGGSDDEIKTEYIDVQASLKADFKIYPTDDPTPGQYKPAGQTIPMVGGNITFDATDSTGDIVKYRWDFGGKGKDIVETSEPIVYHIYDEEKTFSVTLEVVDSNDNKATKTLDFTIPELQLGDILFCNTYGYGWAIPGFHTHCGIYIGHGKIVETVLGAGHGLPANGVGISDIMDWSYQNGETAVAVYRPMISAGYIKNAVHIAKNFATQKPHITYDLIVALKSQAPDRYYCSELVWAAYSLGSGGKVVFTPGIKGVSEGYWTDVSFGEINLGYTVGGWGITPSDIATDPRLQYVAGHWEDEPGSP